jgi:hypothetical protein
VTAGIDEVGFSDKLIWYIKALREFRNGLTLVGVIGHNAFTFPAPLREISA